MDRVDRPSDRRAVDALRSVFHLRDVRRDGERVFYYGESLVPERMLLREVWPAFRRAGYEVQVARTRDSQDVLVATPVDTGIGGVPWMNLLLLVATVCSTLFVGATAWYYIPVSTIADDPLAALAAWPFTAAVLGVLLIHELGHYALARYHGVDVSLPYVIPFILPFGTMGAIIRMRGQMPDRKALFDIGVAGPLAGLAATIVVTVVGLSLGPFEVPRQVLRSGGEVIYFNNPPLLELIAAAIGQPTDYPPPNTVHPVIIGGWVGMFFTVLNLLPVGQLDGGHMVRAMIGDRQETVAALVPLALFGLSGYLYYVRGFGINESVGLWAFWGLFSTFIAFNGPADPIDETGIGWKRQLVGLFTFGLGLLCFMLVPIQLQ
ncbi:site-2 protease family protein [Halegenticoccus tardaugens]|uniref:site-2 protease family protein n=1 Tax=Halegenticoccus tardaugens TaxID=2071624 RepID=UPI00100B7F07|nr:site-2 protease family protein [Halegenticoccus tardaugens]